MMLASLLVVLAGLQPQTQEIDRLIQDLGADDIGVRERAAEKLISFGPQAENLLRKAADQHLDGETRARAKSVLGEIQLAQNRNAAFGSAFRVSLPEGAYTVGRIAEILKEQLGVTVRVPPEESRSSIRVEASQMLFWEFLDRVSKAQGGIVLSENQPEDAVSLVSGKFAERPVRYVGQFRISIEGLRLERRRPWGEQWDRGAVILAVAWQPNVRPIGNSKAEIAVESITELDGTKLEVNPGLESPYRSWQDSHYSPRSQSELISFGLPKGSARRLGNIRGSVKMRLPLRYETISFDHPLETAGTSSRTVGHYTITLGKCERKGPDVSGVVRFALRENASEQEHDQRLKVWDRFSWRDAVLVTEDQTEIQNQSRVSGTESNRLEHFFAFKVESAPKTLKLKFLVDYFEKRLEFEFKDVELP